MKRVPLLAALVAGLLATPAAQTTADGEVLVRIETALGAIDVAARACTSSAASNNNQSKSRR